MGGTAYLLLTTNPQAAALAAAPSDALAQNTKKTNDIVAVAVGAGQYKTLVAADKAAGLDDVLLA